MPKHRFPEPGTRLHVTTGVGVEYTGQCAYHLASQWVLLVDDADPVQHLVVHADDHWERLL